MNTKPGFKFDTIGYWSEVKLEIIQKYAVAYSTIFNAKAQQGFSHVYIDAFAGAGIARRKRTGEAVQGSPLNALEVMPPFPELHFIDLDSRKLDFLQNLVGPDSRAHLYQGDCNTILLQKILPTIQYQHYRRGLCVLDPYGLHLHWQVLKMAGSLRTIDIFLNFPVMDMNRNVLWHQPNRADPADIERMNRFWGDSSWRDAAYRKEPSLFSLLGDDDLVNKLSNDDVVEAFRRRLQCEAGFKYVPQPIPMRNDQGATVYYLFFAAPNATANDIITDIFNKYRNRGVC